MKTNREWMELLSKEWNVSNSTAKEMVHAMHQLKEQDNVKKSFQNIKEIDELGRDQTPKISQEDEKEISTGEIAKYLEEHSISLNKGLDVSLENDILKKDEMLEK